MPLTINAPITVAATWTQFKATVQARNCNMQYFDDGVVYSIFAIDVDVSFICLIYEGTVPAGVINGGYTQAQNDSDKADFETNFKATANKQLAEPLRDRTVTGNLANLGDTVLVSSEGAGVIGLQITGTWVGTVAFESTIDGSTWFNLAAFPPAAAPFVTSTAANGVWKINGSGLNKVRCRASAWTSGTAVVSYDVGAGSTLVAAVQGSAAPLTSAWSMKLTDGTNLAPTMDAAARAGYQHVTDGTNTAAVKAASTAPVAADPALVVAVSPNSSVAVTGTVTVTQATAANLNATVVGLGVAGTPTGGVVTVQGVSGGTALPVSSTQLPAALVGSRLDANVGSWLGSTAPTVGQKTSANSIPVVVASDQSALTVAQATAANFNATVVGLGVAGTPSGGVISVQGVSGGTAQPVSGTVTVTQTTAANLNAAVVGTGTAGTPAGGVLTVQGASAGTALPVSSTQLPAALVGSRLDANVGSWLGSTAPTVGQKTGANSVPVVVASDQSALTVAQATAASLNATVVQGTAAAVAGAWPVKLTDGTNTAPTMDVAARAGFQHITDGTNTAAVKAASTTAVAADPALVVTMSPNSSALAVTSTPVGATTGDIFGRVLGGGASSGTLVAVRATTYTEQTANFTGSVRSSSVLDVNSTGTGAWILEITYYDQTGAGPNIETVNLNGLTAVNLVNTNHCFIEKMRITSFGSTGSNAGTISLFTGAGGTGTLVGTIAFGTVVSTLGDSRTFWAHHYVATGKTASLYQLGGGVASGAQTGILFLKVSTPLVSSAGEVPLSDTVTMAASGVFSTRVITGAIKVSGFARITAYVVPGGNNTTYVASFDYSEQ